jgi:hypothetical protein
VLGMAEIAFPQRLDTTGRENQQPSTHGALAL